MRFGTITLVTAKKSCFLAMAMFNFFNSRRMLSIPMERRLTPGTFFGKLPWLPFEGNVTGNRSSFRLGRGH